MMLKSGSITLSNFVNTTDYFVNCAKIHFACFMKTKISFEATVCTVIYLCLHQAPFPVFSDTVFSQTWSAE